jgi:hypothetical protein
MYHLLEFIGSVGQCWLYAMLVMFVVVILPGIKGNRKD